jgi:hypothetical protein
MIRDSIPSRSADTDRCAHSGSVKTLQPMAAIWYHECMEDLPTAPPAAHDPIEAACRTYEGPDRWWSLSEDDCARHRERMRAAIDAYHAVAGSGKAGRKTPTES